MKHIYSIEGLCGGSDYYDDTGALIAYSVPSIFGGEDIYIVDGKSGYTIDSPIGGVDIYMTDENDN